MAILVSNKYVDKSCFTRFQKSVESISLPEKFTFPFYYEPHPLCVIAAEEVQSHLENQQDWKWDFHNTQELDGICMGKMFGVLVVQNNDGELGYLSAFSGKLADSNHLPGFVPPVFDMLAPDSFYYAEMDKLNVIVAEIKQLESSSEFLNYKNLYEQHQKNASEAILLKKKELKANKLARNKQRTDAKEKLSSEDYDLVEKELIKQSLKDKRDLRDLSIKWDGILEESKLKFEGYVVRIKQLKQIRKKQSIALQDKLFNQYQFLNIKGTSKGLLDIFKDTDQKKPPAAAGECAAPKLLQYAFLHNLKPVAMAEFWWGQSPFTEVRRHGHYYPACRGKCEPILGHMLNGIEMDANPMLVDPEYNKPIEIIYEDEAFAAINKQHEFLSVPGKTVRDSVLERMKQQFPHATGPLIVHRLDMSTSGIMLIAKTEQAYRRLQGQFIKRKVNKTYVAVLDGIVTESDGEIELPLRVDLDDRPRQMVCYEYGKPAKTKWKVIERSEGKTRIEFMPVTGRTHQLRVHAAHRLGLNTPILGDDLYGAKADRLYLHAQSIEFYHPVTNDRMTLEVKAEF